MMRTSQTQMRVPRGKGRPSDRMRRLGDSARAAVVQGNLQAAEQFYLEAIALGTVDSDVYNNLAAIYDRWGGRLEDEIELLARSLELAPESQDVRKNLIKVLIRQRTKLVQERKFKAALPFAQLLVDLVPDSAAHHRELGDCYAKSGKLEEAVKQFTRAINLEPNNAGHYNDLGLACFELRCLAEAQGAFQEVLRLQPTSIVAYTHLGLLANITGLSGVAVSLLERAVKMEPNSAVPHINLGLFLRDQGELRDCRFHYEEALRLSPSNVAAMSGHLLSLNGDPSADPAWIGSEHRRFDALVKTHPRAVRTRDPDPERRLRVAYLSPDFRVHSVAFFMLSILEKRNRDEAEIYCYATGRQKDAMTAELKGNVDVFREVYRMSDDDLAALIQEDGIDILVELSGHTADNRLVMLANRVAPLQVTYLGYPNTTGLSAMDYRITDEVADPVGVSDAWHTEKLVRVAGGFLAYRPVFLDGEIAVEPMPMEKTGHITFGCFNNLAKVNDLVLDTWARILAEVPESELLLKAKGLRSEKVRTRIVAALAARGVSSDRVRLLEQEKGMADHLLRYNEMDIALDTFPYNGTTTTCEALWMGAPVVTFEGNCHAGRVGASLLMNAGLHDLVAKDRQGYIDRAVALGRDRHLLATARQGLRYKFTHSSVTDAARLAKELERFYRAAWRTHCQTLT